MGRQRIAMALVGCLALVALGLSIGGVLAAWRGTGFSDSAAALVGTIAGGTLAAIAALMGRDNDGPGGG